MSLTTNLSNAFTRVATEIKSVRTLMNGNTADLSGLSTTAKNNLVAAINEVYAGLGQTSYALTDLTDVTLAAPATGHILRHNGTEWVNVIGTDFYQPLDADLTAIAAGTTTAYGRGLLALADQAALMALLGSATATAKGIVELATDTEVTTGTDTTRAITPASLKAELDARFAALIDGAPGLLDTLNEIAAALGDDPNFATTITTALGKRVRVDTNAQGLTAQEQANARTNIDVYSKAEIGDVNTDFVAVFEAGLV
jgi:hypothetical protein